MFSCYQFTSDFVVTGSHEAWPQFFLDWELCPAVIFVGLFLQSHRHLLGVGVVQCNSRYVLEVTVHGPLFLSESLSLVPKVVMSFEY